jgi:4-phosphopantoate--beta-alanine ligase
VASREGGGGKSPKDALEAASADLTDVPESHPRRRSLEMRQKLVAAVESGLAHPSGLTAHGRGEAFDYLLGERTVEEAEAAARAAAELLIAAERPVVSVNGNVAALAALEVVELALAVNSKRASRRELFLEANVFHAGESRVRRIVEVLEAEGAESVLGRNRSARIPGLASHRALCESEGIFAADVVLVPLEDGDRTEALKAMGKVVIAIDLNPLSRTARAADVTIVDHLVRALPRIANFARRMDRPPHQGVKALAKGFDNQANLMGVRHRIAKALEREEE